MMYIFIDAPLLLSTIIQPPPKVALKRAEEILAERVEKAAKEAAEEAAGGKGAGTVKRKPLVKQAATELLRSFGSFRQLEVGEAFFFSKFNLTRLLCALFLLLFRNTGRVYVVWPSVIDNLSYSHTSRKPRSRAFEYLSHVCPLCVRVLFLLRQRRYKGMQETAVTRELKAAEEALNDAGDGSASSSTAAAAASKVSSLLDRGMLRLLKRDYDGSREVYRMVSCIACGSGWGVRFVSCQGLRMTLSLSTSYNWFCVCPEVIVGSAKARSGGIN